MSDRACAVLSGLAGGAVTAIATVWWYLRREEHLT